MRILIVFANLLMLCSLIGCCRPWQDKQPPRPENVQGWTPYRVGTVRVIGEFVLREGEHTESDSLGVEIVNISPLITCLGPIQEPPRKSVTLKLYKPADKMVLCQATLGEDSGTLPCPNGSSLPSVSVNGINTKERWVTLSLNETAPDE